MGIYHSGEWYNGNCVFCPFTGHGIRHSDTSQRETRRAICIWLPLTVRSFVDVSNIHVFRSDGLLRSKYRRLRRYPD